MKIEKIQINGFGKFENKNIELNDGINIIVGKNESGKSTLLKFINSMLYGISKNKRGKNTTTTVKLYKIQDNTYIADTPGFSTFDISEISYKDLDKYFVEIRENIKDCEFVGCTHIKEENCGVKKALEEGKINQGRYDRFCKIYQELKSREENKKW